MKKKIILIIVLFLLVASSGTYLYITDKHNKELEAIKLAEEEERLRLEEEARQKELARLKKIEEANEIFDQRLIEIAEENSVTGISIAIFDDGEIIHTANYGYQDKANNILTNDNTKYRIASISKNITCVGLMKLYEEGLFELDDYIKDVTGIDYDSSKGRVTFKDLLTHTAGIMDYGSKYNAALQGARLSIDEALSDAHASYNVGEEYQYSNFGMSSVGAIIEHLTGEYFGRYMRLFFEELDIDAAYSSDLITDTESIAKLYDGSNIYDVSNWFKKSSYYESYGLGNSYLQGDCELIISASDLAKIAIALSNGGYYEDKQILKQETLDLMFDEYIDVYNDETGAYRYTEGLSCHNFKTLVEGRQIHGHTGGALGVISAMYFDIEDHNGIIILDNGAKNIKNENGNNCLLYDLVNECYKDYFN